MDIPLVSASRRLLAAGLAESPTEIGAIGAIEMKVLRHLVSHLAGIGTSLEKRQVGRQDVTELATAPGIDPPITSLHRVPEGTLVVDGRTSLTNGEGCRGPSVRMLCRRRES